MLLSHAAARTSLSSSSAKADKSPILAAQPAATFWHKRVPDRALGQGISPGQRSVNFNQLPLGSSLEPAPAKKSL